MQNKKRKSITLTSFFEEIFNEIDRRKAENNLKMSAKTIERLANEFRRSSKNMFLWKLKKFNSHLYSKFKQYYRRYVEKDFKKNNRNIRPYKLNQLKPHFRKEMENRIQFSLNLIKTQSQESMLTLTDRFMNWCNGNHKESLKSSLKLGQTTNKEMKHYNLILQDQTRKMIGNFDNIVAENYGAIGFFWRTRRDSRVVGNPTGKYPGKGNKIHGDHYHREGVFFLYENQIKKYKPYLKKEVKTVKELEDGLPGQPIYCRCYAENIYHLEDLPRNLLSKKGKEHLEAD